ncbi:MAG TPA: xanthine dehydrogenase family protein subunit M [Candidatus Baltobacteraceae bacterium]|nr:xanthine dehydrogenase family protein subunit M [Candidatus Baltobacteraceae bacterium]
MFPAPFEYFRAETVDEALSLLGRYGGDARVLAGGQSLIPAMRFRLARPAVLVDINALADLAYVRESDGRLTFGALARDAEVEHDPTIRARYKMIADTSFAVADPVVRQTGTVVGSLCHNDPAGDWAVTALAGRAEIVVRGGGGARVVPIDDFLVDSFTTAVGEGEMALEARFPTPPARTAGAFEKIERKVGDFATVSAAARVTLAADGTIADAQVALGAVGPTAIRAGEAEALLRGATPSRELLRAAADAAAHRADPVADTRGSADYKKAMAGVLVRRALETALGRLGVEGLR